jgi:hypothetical protein
MHKAINAKFNVGDFVLVDQFGSGYKRGKVVSLSGPNAKVEFVGGGTDTVPLHRLTASNCSTANSVVAKAVANARAANAAFKVGDKVKANPKFLEFCPPEMKGREWTVTSVYGLGLGDGGGFFDLKSGDKRLSGIPSVKCVAANSSAEPTVAKNGAADVLVSFTTITAKGLEKVQARMTESDFDVWAKKVGAGDTQNVYKELATSGKAGFAITRPLSVTVTQL